MDETKPNHVKNVHIFLDIKMPKNAFKRILRLWRLHKCVRFICSLKIEEIEVFLLVMHAPMRSLESWIKIPPP